MIQFLRCDSPLRSPQLTLFETDRLRLTGLAAEKELFPERIEGGGGGGSCEGGAVTALEILALVILLDAFASGTAALAAAAAAALFRMNSSVFTED
jgi:hypothetical protein